MRCGHCKSEQVSIGHVRACADAERVIQQIGAVRREPVAATLASEPVAGIYVNDEGVYVNVVKGRTTGNFYAKIWNGASWEYAGRGPLHHLSAANKITAEQAAEFGHTVGSCVFCGRTLTDDRSVTVGYGPVCADHHGLPWGEAVAS